MDRILAIFAWVVITGVVSLIVLAPFVVDSSDPGEAEIGETLSEEADIGGTQADDAGERMISPQDEMLGKVVVSFKVLLSSPEWRPMIQQEIAPLEDGTPGQRLGWVIIQGALNGMPKGLEELDRFADSDTVESEEPLPHAEVELVRAAMEAGQEGGTPLTASQVEALEQRLGVFGEIAVGFSDPVVQARLEKSATRGGITMVAAGGLFVLGGLVGFVLLVIFLILALTQRMKSRFVPAVRSGVYAETFAVWLLLFLALQFLVGALGYVHPGFTHPLAMSILVFFLSLGALAWPVIRGRTWSEVRKDIGWTMGGNPIAEVCAGLGTWTMALPFMGVGLILTFVLTLLVQYMTGTTPEPSHPIQEQVMSAGGLALFSLFFVACIAAPVVEETVFRGILYQHLRSGTLRAPTWVSILVAVAVSSFIFAAIHPQGLVFIPPLGGLAAGFCIGREWRGSLIAPMVAHGFSNAVVLSVNVALFS
ncbi:MAG: CPBP family intramembrane metalloprotease [Phycisphaerales bacterium]|nr:CPBP family intramembrane metalloprotease [Phycisphaerales bacterium]